MEFKIHRSNIRQIGISYVETLITVVIVAILVSGLMGIVGTATDINEKVSSENEIIQQTHYAMERMVSATRRTRRLLLPLVDKPASNWPEHIREQTIPPSPPIGDSVFATAVLAVTLPADIDLDNDGFADADDDRDGQIDEDLPDDINNDFAPGIAYIDDDGDGLIDEDGFFEWNDDETSTSFNEDPIDGVDNDGDGNIDEDPGADNNADFCSGVCGVDDDSDGSIDEAAAADDDEDGQANEDWYNALVFYLSGNELKERTPVPWDETGVGGVTGLDFIESTIAEHVTHFRVERIPSPTNSTQVVDLLLELTHPITGESFSVQTQVRIGSGL